MAKILTDVSTFSADVTVPEGGDARTAVSVEPAFQKLANRTRYAKDLLDAKGMYARFPISGASVAHATKLTLGAADIDSEDFEIDSDEIVCPAAGVYLVSVRMTVTSSQVVAGTVGCLAYVAGVPQLKLHGYRTTTETSEQVHVAASGLVEIADPETDTIRVITDDAGQTTTVHGSYNFISVVRVV